MGNGVPVGVDLGNGFVKEVAAGIRLSFGSAIVPWTKTLNGSKVGVVPPNTYVLEMDNETSLVGTHAARQSKTLLTNMDDIRWLQPSITRKLIATGLALMQDRTKADTFNVVTGLPLSHFDTYAARAAEILRGDYEGILNGSPFRFRVNVDRIGIGVMRCTIATWMEAVQLDTDGNAKEIRKLGVIDIGTGTTDLTVIESLPKGDGSFKPTLISDESGSFENGWLMVTSSVRKHLLNRGTDSDHWTIDQAILASRKMGVVDIEEATDDGVENLGNAIAQNISALWGNADLIDKIVLCGGPAETMLPVIKKITGIERIEILPDPLFATASGYHRMAQHAV